MNPNEFKFNDQTLAVRAINADVTSYGGFKNSTEVGSKVTPEKWVADSECGNGIHCWPWGISRGGKKFAGDKIWQVVEITGESVMLEEGKCKAEEVTILYSGNEAEAMRFTMNGRISYLRSISEYKSTNTSDFSSSSNTGNYSSASNTGNFSNASNTGDYSSSSNTGSDSSASNTGNFSNASNTGNFSNASNTGDYSSSSNTGSYSSSSNTGSYSSSSNTGSYSSASNTGYRSSASNTGEASLSAVTGLFGKVRGGINGVIVLAWKNNGIRQLECAKVDGIYILPNVWYKLDENGKFVECEND